MQLNQHLTQTGTQPTATRYIYTSASKTTDQARHEIKDVECQNTQKAVMLNRDQILETKTDMQKKSETKILASRQAETEILASRSNQKQFWP